MKSFPSAAFDPLINQIQYQYRVRFIFSQTSVTIPLTDIDTVLITRTDNNAAGSKNKGIWLIMNRTLHYLYYSIILTLGQYIYFLFFSLILLNF